MRPLSTSEGEDEGGAGGDCGAVLEVAFGPGQLAADEQSRAGASCLLCGLLGAGEAFKELLPELGAYSRAGVGELHGDPSGFAVDADASESTGVLGGVGDEIRGDLVEVPWLHGRRDLEVT